MNAIASLVKIMMLGHPMARGALLLCAWSDLTRFTSPTFATRPAISSPWGAHGHPQGPRLGSRSPRPAVGLAAGDSRRSRSAVAPAWLTAVATAFAVFLFVSPARAESKWGRRIFSVGDLHGDYQSSMMLCAQI